MSRLSHLSRLKVLVVEDDPLLRLDAVDLVEEAGFEAVEAANADEALRLLERDPTIRILFTDVDMPGSMDGLMLAHLVHHRWPPMAILVTSGHLRVRPETLPENGQFFAKPYRCAQVQEAMSRAAHMALAA
ncbi:response regulator [Aureimonas leprariae]|uniref:Response regulator n=1 Tax=Plantimonas leprariae TaxID=2615207 RepID=A0A7V7PN04_9HYPH|nr:response regulator [Aureimonas leprariae]KAB0678848.1 response regulator [Aureimonas leprariae]